MSTTTAPPKRPAPVKSLTGHRSAYLVGIGGTGMSGAAELLKARGIRVRGSDRGSSPRTERLESLGIPVDADDAPGAIPADATLLVASAAVPPTHPQMMEAARRGLEVWKYAECLGALMEDRVGICVAGCHGKTTTSSLVATTLWRAGRAPSFVIGGEVKDVGAGAHAGSGAHFVAEACEFDRSFHNLKPRIAIVTNVDEDHLDYYSGLPEIEESFRDFARLLPRSGLLVVHEEFADLFRHDLSIVAHIETYGTSHAAEWRATPSGWDATAQASRFTVERGSALLGEIAVPLAGAHNVLNATAAVAALTGAGLSFGEIAAGLACFGGVGRRLEFVAEKSGVLIYDDYGHHPAEIEAVVKAVANRHPGRRLVIVFQPHQASRTRCLLEGFATSLSLASEAWLPPIYFARDSEEERRSVSSTDLAARMRAMGGHPTTFPSLSALVDHAAAHVRPGDVVVTMGAGNVDEVARGLADRLR